MDYKVKYEQAIADARAIIKDYKERHLDNIAKRSEEDFSAVFPELKESEDERIRKKLIEAVKGDMVVGGTKDKQLAIAWLEKQGEQKHQYKSRPRYVGEEELLGANEKGEQKPVEEIKIFQKWYICIEGVENFSKGHLYKSNIDDQGTEWISDDTGHDFIYGFYFSYFRPATEEEIPHKPKFKVGDWITNGDYTWKIVEIKPLDYILQSQDCIIVDDTISYVDNHFHLWSIEDAKAGDVIAADGYIILFKELLPQNGGVSYCHYDYACTNPQFNFNEDNNWHFGKESKIHPATKEEREQLEKVMADAGYVWLSGEKELKKIEQKPVPKFEVGDVMRTLQEAADNITSGLPVVVSIDNEYYHCNNELIAIKDQNDYEYPPMNRIQKQKWSEENDDEAWLNDIICKVEFDCTLNKDEKNWLKSLKDRIQARQEWSEEDKKMIDSIYISLNSESIAEGLRCRGTKYNADDLETILFKQRSWLKSIRPQQRQEWSEEDEKMLHNLITLIRSGAHFAYEEEIAWLKSLSPKNHWKPSEEMLEALDIAIRAGIQLGSWEEKALRELQKQLKAL